jgi:hypothetical protein
MSEFVHVLGRAALHFVSSSGILLMAFFALHFVQRKKRWPWLPALVQPQLLFAAVCVFAGSALREAYDVAQGQSLAKAVCDYASWILGCGVSVWGLWRMRSV